MDLPSKLDTWCAVVNIFAASKTAVSKWEIARTRLLSDGVNHLAVFTGKEGNAMQLTKTACADGYRRFIAVGGDGTVHDVLQGIMCFIEESVISGRPVSLSDFLMAVIPLGSGNDWIKTAGIPADIDQAASLIASGETACQDVVKVSLLDPHSIPAMKPLNTVYMANVGGVGLDARVCVSVNKAKSQGKRGKFLYVKALADAIMKRVPTSVAAGCDGVQVFSGKYLSMSLGIGKYSGGGMRQTPDAVMDDGLLDLTVIPDLPLMKIAKEAPKLFSGRLNMVPELVMTRGKSIEVLTADELVEVDGEVVGCTPVRFDVMTEQLPIRVPRRHMLS